MREINFTFEKIQKAVKKLKTKNIKGPDGLSPLVIKNLKDSICLPLMLICNASYNSGKILLAWKSAHVTPVFKKGLSSAVSNYRPISLTCVCCRLMESIINDDMSSYLLTNNLITEHQHGFLKKHSTCTQLIECTNDWSLSLNQRKATDVVYVDFPRLSTP